MLHLSKASIAFLVQSSLYMESEVDLRFLGCAGSSLDQCERVCFNFLDPTYSAMLSRFPC